MTKAEYVKKGNTICKKAEEERFAIFEEESQKLSPKEEREREKQEEVLLAGMRSYERAIEKLDELGLPAGSEEKAESLLGSMEEAFERVQQDPGTVLVSDAPFKKANEEAESLGLDNCVT
ncbi:MAG TPA: hypothetical protein VFJ76_03410 [Solirubrobacterales bacterium]|nr:hypothetical protein [Solirubrobacterales bacterium]